jgi:hypothetical protein
VGPTSVRLAIVILIAAGLNFDCVGGPSASTGSSPSASQACAWPILANIGTNNAGLVDSAAAYWLDTFQVQSDLRIVLTGRYPDARYASISVYTSLTSPFTTNGVGSDLTDYQIAPDAGSVNPWQHSGPPGGKFTITLRPDPSQGEANTLPLAPTGTPYGSKGYLQYRVYLPAEGDFSKLVAPTITLQQGGHSTTLRNCANPGVPSASAPAAATPSPQPSATGSSPATPGQLQFRRPKAQTTTVGFTNTDSAYLITSVVAPSPSSVVVIQGKAPIASTGDHPSPWPAAMTDVRYWSMCVYLGAGLLPLVANPLPDGTRDVGCRYDEQTKLNAAGQYTFVIGTESQRVAIEQIPDVTFLPFSSAQPTALYVLLLRNMLVNSAFGFPIQQVPQDGNPASAAAVLGASYPKAVKCTLSTLNSGGPPACLTQK